MWHIGRGRRHEPLHGLAWIGLDDVAHERPREERVAAGAGVNGLDQLRGRRSPDPGSDELSDLALRQPGKRHLLEALLAPQVVE